MVWATLAATAGGCAGAPGPPGPPGADAWPAPARPALFVLEDVRLTARDGLQVAWEGTAAGASGDLDVIALTAPALGHPGGGAPGPHLRAPSGTLALATACARVEPTTRVDGADHTLWLTAPLAIDLRADRLDSAGPLRLDGPTLSVQATGLAGTPSGRRAHLTGPVQGQLRCGVATGAKFR